LSGRSKLRQIAVVHVSKAGKEEKNLYEEMVVVTRIEYNDGTFWQQPEH
jgi:hypothetical protein